MERHSFRIVLGNSAKTMQKLCLSTKLPHQEITWNYAILRSACFDNPGLVYYKSVAFLTKTGWCNRYFRQTSLLCLFRSSPRGWKPSEYICSLKWSQLPSMSSLSSLSLTVLCMFGSSSLLTSNRLGTWTPCEWWYNQLDGLVLILSETRCFCAYLCDGKMCYRWQV